MWRVTSLLLSYFVLSGVCGISLLKWFNSVLRWFFLIFFLISWSLITLQYCSGFCHTLTRISHGFTCIPHPDPPSHLPLHPIPVHQVQALVSCIQPGLVICFTLDNMMLYVVFYTFTNCWGDSQWLILFIRLCRFSFGCHKDKRIIIFSRLTSPVFNLW